MDRRIILAAGGAAVVALSVLLAVSGGEEAIRLSGGTGTAEAPEPQDATRAQSPAAAPAAGGETVSDGGSSVAAAGDASAETPDPHQQQAPAAATASEPGPETRDAAVGGGVASQAEPGEASQEEPADAESRQEPRQRETASAAGEPSAQPASGEASAEEEQTDSASPAAAPPSTATVTSSAPDQPRSSEDTAPDTETRAELHAQPQSGPQVTIPIGEDSGAGSGRSEAEQLAALPDSEAQQPTSPLPGFDVVRVEPNGDTVVAGSATPGSVVTLYDGERALASVVADRNGNWVLLPEDPLAPGSHELTLRARLPDGGELVSDRAVLVVVPEPPRMLAKGPETGSEAGPPEQPLAMLVPRTGEGGAEVLQRPEGEGLRDQQLVLSAVDYDEEGRIVITGRAAAGAIIVAFLDGQPIGRALADGSGHWTLSPEASVSAGLHRLRVDQMNAAGAVVASVETPFSRAEMLTTLPGERFVIVQPGNSLWRIARRTYGEGIRYTVIYRSNSEQIRDPDLIYPGQVFLLPEVR